MKDLNYYLGLNYRIEVEKDETEGGYVLSIPELRGCITCADSIEEGFQMIEDAKKEWLITAIENKNTISEPSKTDDYSGQYKLRMPKSLHKELMDRARSEGVSMNQYCVYLLSKKNNVVNLHV